MAKKKTENNIDELMEEELVKEDEQPYAVPGNWVWVKFENVKKDNDSFGDGDWILTKNLDDNGSVRLLQLADIGTGGFLDKSSRNISEKTFQELNCTEISEGDVLISRMADPIARSCIIPRLNKKLITAVDVAYLRVNPNISSNYFINYLCNSTFFKLQAEKISRGTTRKRITRKNLAALPTPLPPLPEQERIVKKLSSMLGKLKEARELIQEAKDTFEERRAAILNKAFTGELTKKWRKENPEVESVDNIFATILNNKKKNNKGKKNADIVAQKRMEIAENETPYDVPPRWKWARFGDVCETIKDGTHFSPKWQYREDGESRYLYITSRNIRDHGFEFDNVAYIDENVHKEIYQRCDPKLGDILLVKDGAKTGTVIINTIDKEFSLLSSVAVLKVFVNTLEPNYIKNFLKSPTGRNIIFGQISGSAITRITLEKINKFILPISPIEEQKEIVRILEKVLDHEDEAKALIDMEEQIDLLEKSIISKAFRGKLGTNDHKDDPAIKLLKRSLKEKAKANQNPKTILPRQNRESEVFHGK